MFKLVPFKGEHIMEVLKDPINAAFVESHSRAELHQWLEAQDYSFTGFLDDKVAVCGGITPYWPGRGHIWTMFNGETRENFLPVFRGIQDFLSSQLEKNFHRIEVSIPCEFELGRRRAELLGFRLECEFAEKYLPDGRDASVYSMIRRESMNREGVK